MKRRILSIPIIVIIVLLTTVSVGTAALLIGGGGNSENVNLSKGLVGWWKMDGDAKDSTPYGNNGTVTGAVLATDRKGTANKAYDFDGGASTNISVTDATGSSLDLTTAVTVSAWVNVQTTGTKGIVSKGGAGGNEPNGPYSLWTIGTTIYWEVGDDVNNPSISSTLTAGTWQHWVGTYSNSTLTLYRNGVKVTGPTGVTVSSMVQNNNALLFADSTGTVANLDASIDDVRIYNRALTATEITALYQEYDPGIVISDLQKGLVGWWKMDGDAKDSTPRGNNGTVTEAVLSTDRKGQANKAYDFDGTNDIIQTADGISVFNIASELTYSAWFYVDTGNSGWQRPFQKFQDLSSGNVPYYGISYGNVANTFMCEFTDSDTAEYAQYSASVSSPSGSWYHVVCVASQSAGGFDIYVNGVDKGGANWFTSGTINTGNRPITIGGARAAGTYWNGKIDDVRIYNRALSATEITALYQEYDPGIQVSDLQKGLVGQWSFDGDAKDRTPYGNNGASDTGGTITYSGGYTIHTFTSSGTFTTYGSKNVEVLVVGGGGGGGTTGGRGGGGGAGGYQYNSSFAVTAQAYTVTVGAGGAKGVYNSSCSQNGQDSVFSTITATGGGRGGGTSNIACSTTGGNGGSGGGGEGNTSGIGGTGSQGSNGGAGSTTDYGAGGGGGAGGAGANGTSNIGGAGGTGTSNSISGASVCYAGGGGGGFTGSGGSATCGGGAGASAVATAGTANTGGGGGGANTGADGGSGIVIIRYPTLNTIADRKGQTAKAYSFNGTSDYVYVGNAGSGIKTVSFWMQADDTTTRKIIDIDGTDQIELDASSNITATSFPGTTTIYVDGVVASNIADTNWHFVTITDTTGVSASGFNIGAVATSYFDGKLDDIRVYNRVLSAAEVTALYESY